MSIDFNNVIFNAVTFSYEGSEKPLFQDLRFTAGEGWTGIVGENGAGKSTLLRLAAGELKPDLGHVHAPESGLYCAQRTDHAPDGLERLLMATDSQSQKLKQQLGLQPDWALRWHTLSFGERKRAQVAFMLAQDPPFLAVDEPTNHLDKDSRDLVWRALAQFRGVGLLVSHDRDLLDALCSQCLFLGSPIVMRPGGYSEGARQAAQERSYLERTYSKAAREVKALEAELHQRRQQTALEARQRSKRGIPKGDHDAKAKVDAARCSDGGSGQRLRQMEGRFSQAAERQGQIKVNRSFATGIRMDGHGSHRPLVIPANHLDLPSVECLEMALESCQSTLILVSHDQPFLNRLATRHWHIEQKGHICFVMEKD